MKINRRTLFTGLTAVAATAAFSGYHFWLQPKRRPNIVLFIADDVRYDAAGFAGNTIIQTPHLDALAKESCIFTNCFVTTSICCTSRASIMMGEYAIKHGIYDFDAPLTTVQQQRIFPVLLRHAGYHTGYVGKWGIGHPELIKDWDKRNIPNRSFDYWKGYAGQNHYMRGKKGNKQHITDIQTEQAVNFLNSAPEDKPFMLIVSYKAAHGPPVIQKRFSELYKDVSIPRSKTDPVHGHMIIPRLIAKHSRQVELYQKTIGTDKEYQRWVKRYYQLITGMDESIGKILAILDQKRIWRDTYVIYTSDNGFVLGEHGMFRKTYMWEESIRVPLLIKPAKDDGISSQIIPGISLNVDIAPTLLSIAGIMPPPAMQGSNLLDLMRGENASWRNGFFYESPRLIATALKKKTEPHTLFCEGYRSSTWKYAHYYTKDKESEELMFNLADDPYEMNNLAALPEYAEKLSELRQLTLDEKKRLSA